jgi:formylglycine-generating enzyme required for sulfatase activity
LDPEGSDYQGYLTVDGTDEIATCVPADEGTMYGNLTLAWTKVRSASRYHIRVSTGVLWISDDVTDLDTSAIVFEDSSCPANVCVLPEEGLESGSSYYWQVRAMDSETGAWGLWSSVSSFSYAEGSAPLVSVPGGTFLMGYILGDSDETTERMITLDSFCIGTYEVTRSLYKFIMGEDPSGWMPYSDSGAYPVESVSWRDAVDFCNALSEYEGLDPVYSTGLGRVKADLSRNGYRLPTEAEWEYGARGGPFSLGYLYAGSDTEYEVSWFFFNGSNPTVVGSLEPNELGIYDMSGNVAEWCWDWYYDYQYSDLEDVDNPQGPKSGSYRVIRAVPTAPRQGRRGSPTVTRGIRIRPRL